jgi:hypothetical protein
MRKKNQLKKNKRTESTRLTCQTRNPVMRRGQPDKKKDIMLKDMRTR